MKRILICLALLGSVAHAEKSPNGMPDTAFVFEARIAAGAPVSILGYLVSGTAFTAIPSLFVGARLIDRIHVGLGLQFFRLQGSASTGLGTTATSDYVIEFEPLISADLFKSGDNRAAFYLKFGIPLGPVITCPGGGAPCDNNFGVGFDIGLGVRYAVHRNVGLGVEAGVAGAFIGPQRNDTTGEVSFYGALVGTFWSGH
jgi:hypothetical protein